MKRAVTAVILLAFLFGNTSVYTKEREDPVNKAIQRLDEVGIERYDKIITRGEAMVLLANTLGLNSTNVVKERYKFSLTRQIYVEEFSFYGANYMLCLFVKGIGIGRPNEQKNYGEPSLSLDPWNDLSMEEAVTMLTKAWIPQGEEINLDSGYAKAVEIGLINNTDPFYHATRTKKVTVGEYYIILSRFLDLKCNKDKSFFANIEHPENYTYLELLKMTFEDSKIFNTSNDK